MHSTFTIQDEFPPVDYDQWRALVEVDLKGVPFEQKLVTHTYEGIDIQPVYTRRDQLNGDDPFGLPGRPPFVRGSSPFGTVQSGWDIRQEYTHPDLATTNRAILDDLAGGTTSALLQLDLAARDGLDPDNPPAAKLAGHDGVMAYSVDDFDTALSDVHLHMIAVALEAGAAFFPAAAMLAALWRRRKIWPDQARGAFNADPLGVLAARGHLPFAPATALTLLSELAAWTDHNYPHVTAVGINTAVYHHAGATAAQDIAFAVATAVEYLRAMTTLGLDVEAAAGQIAFNFRLGTHHFHAISKLRAARRVWSRVIEASGGGAPAGAMHIHARLSRRVLTVRDPYVNLLRNTAAVFAAGLGGAETVTSEPFDSAIGPPDDFSRRIARNTALILQEETHLHRVIDPTGGSWFLDQLTQQVAEKAWSIFQEVERQGGMLAALANGWVAAQIDTAFAPRAKNIARRIEGITGVSEFPDVHEVRVSHPPIDRVALRTAAVNRLATRRCTDIPAEIAAVKGCSQSVVEAAMRGATIGQLARALGFGNEPFKIAPVVLRAFAEPFEALRDVTDQWFERHGKRPTVFLANLGPVSHYTARATYSKNFFESGGFEVITGDGSAEADAAAKAFAKSGATIAVICSSDKLYPELVPQAAAKLKAAGAEAVVLAGNPVTNEQAWRAAGVDWFIFVKCDALATLREILRDVGVIDSAEQ